MDVFELLSPEIRDKLVPLDLRRNPYLPWPIAQTGEVLHPEEKIIILDASYISSSAYLGNPR